MVIANVHIVDYDKTIFWLLRRVAFLHTSVPEVKIRLSSNVACAKEDEIEVKSLVLFRVIHTRTFRHDLSSLLKTISQLISFF
jgi:hypothetical protein